jgi:hypothetical protein
MQDRNKLTLDLYSSCESAIHSVTSRTACRIRKHPHPLPIYVFTHGLIPHVERTFDDIVGATTCSTYDQIYILEEVRHLRPKVGGYLTCRDILTGYSARHH